MKTEKLKPFSLLEKQCCGSFYLQLFALAVADHERHGIGGPQTSACQVMSFLVSLTPGSKVTRGWMGQCCAPGSKLMDSEVSPEGMRKKTEVLSAKNETNLNNRPIAMSLERMVCRNAVGLGFINRMPLLHKTDPVAACFYLRLLSSRYPEYAGLTQQYCSAYKTNKPK